MPQAMQPIVRGANIVSEVVDVSPHVSVPEGELLEVGVDYTYMGPEGSQVTILVCKCKRTGCLAATQVPERGMDAYALAFFALWLRGLGRKRLLLRSDNERALLAFLRAAAASLEGVEVIEQASPEGDTQRMDSQRLVCEKSHRRLECCHLEEGLMRQLDWSEPNTQRIACRDTKFKHMGRRPISITLENVGDVKLSSLERKRHSYRSRHDAKRRVAGDAERMMDGIFVGHHERTGASLFLSERLLSRGTRVQRKTVDQQWDNEFVRKRPGVPWMLTGEEFECEVRAQSAEAQVHSETRCGTVWTDARMRGLRSSGRRSTRRSHIPTSAGHACTSSCSVMRTHW